MTEIDIRSDLIDYNISPNKDLHRPSNELLKNSQIQKNTKGGSFFFLFQDHINKNKKT